MSTAEPNNGKWGFRGVGQGQDASFPDSVTPGTNADLLVYRLDFPAAGDLVAVTFYANPPAGPTPPPTESGSGAVHNFTFDGIRLGTDFTMNFDEVRVGGSWAEVVPTTALPSLKVQQIAPGQIQISWPVSLTGYTLQSSTSLAGGWGPAGLSVTTQNGQSVATDTIAGQVRFYRLHQQ